MPSQAELLARCTFPAEGTAINCAVSGGADSLTLMILGVAAGCDVTAIHVDHGLRSGSADEANVVKDAAVRFGAHFVSMRSEVAGGPNLEARARAARFSVLPAGTFTGHTADDQAETVLLNLLRGAGIDGLAGMTSQNHPLLGIRRRETRQLCEELELQPVEDPSNHDPSILRNRVRHELMPVIDALAGRDVAAVIARQTHLIHDEITVLDELASEIDPTDARAVAAAPRSLARRALRAWLRSNLDIEQHPPDQDAIERVLAVAQGSAIACDISNGIRVRRSRQRLRIESNIERIGEKRIGEADVADAPEELDVQPSGERHLTTYRIRDT